MAQKQITFDGQEIEKDCRNGNTIYTRLNPTMRDIEDAINPDYRALCRPKGEKKIDEFGARQ